MLFSGKIMVAVNGSHLTLWEVKHSKQLPSLTKFILSHLDFRN